MNENTKKYWEDYWKDKEIPANVVAEQFGNEQIADELAHLIVIGKKTATCSAHILYEMENSPLPEVGLYTIILDSKEEPVAIIRTTEVQLIKMNEVSEELAILEGEGDLTYKYWYDGHVKFFTEEFQEYNLQFTDNILLVFEHFELIDVKEKI